MKFTTSSTANSDGTIQVSIEGKNSNVVAQGTSQEIAKLLLDYSSNISNGVYTVTIKNIVLTDADGNTYNAQPYTTEIYIGTSPKVVTSNGVAAFHGNYSNEAGYDLMFESLPTGGTIDLTEVSAMCGDPTALKTDNVIVTNDKVAYGRKVNGYQWTTLCLPFAIEPNEDVKLYQISEVSDNTLTLSSIESAPANTPVICKVTEDASGFAFSASKDGTFNINYTANSVNPTANPIDNWSIIGSYHSENITTTNSYTYAIYNDKFWRVTQQLTISPFRAYLVSTVELGACGAPIRIIEGTEGIEEIEQDNGVVTLSFDLQGRRVNDETRNNLVIENGQVKFIK